MNKLKQVAVLMDSSSGWGRQIIEGILAEAFEYHRWHMRIAPMDGMDPTCLPPSWKGDGIIARVPTNKIVRYLDRFRVPVVNVSSIALSGEKYPRIMPDHEKACQLALDHFKARGFRRFGYVGPTHLPWVTAHFEAFQKVVAEHGGKQSIFTSPSEFTSQRECKRWLRNLALWLQEQPKPFAVLAWSASLGREVVEACLTTSLLVPHEVAVLSSSSDELLDRACDPPLGGIEEPGFEIGRLAARYLDRLIRSDKGVPPLTRVEPTRLVSRGSADTVAVDNPIMINVMRYIDVHALEHDCSVRTILQNISLTRRSLERNFRESFGRSPTDEIGSRRIARARTLLMESDLSMADIAHSCGYSSYNYLHTVFKKATGRSPSEFRAQARLRYQK